MSASYSNSNKKWNIDIDWSLNITISWLYYCSPNCPDDNTYWNEVTQQCEQNTCSYGQYETNDGSCHNCSREIGCETCSS